MTPFAPVAGRGLTARQNHADNEPAVARSASSTLRNSVFARCCLLIGRYSARSGDSSYFFNASSLSNVRTQMNSFCGRLTHAPSTRMPYLALVGTILSLECFTHESNIPPLTV